MTTIEGVWVVLVPARMDAVYLFRNEADARRFVAVCEAADAPVWTPICHANDTDALVEQETE